MGKWLKRILAFLVIGFVLFYLVNQPEGAAATVKSIITWIGGAVNALVTFFTALSG